MCGLVGLLGGIPGTCNDADMLRSMSDSLIHRGPDDGGVWIDSEQRIGLGHRRLEIVDLSSAGHQPMVSASGRFVIVFNGEVYNHFALRKALGNHIKWYGHSDTETLLAGIEAWGLEATLGKSAGMFAIALWDRHQRILSLARDRVGEKPLYYGWLGRGNQRVFLFASELKALKVHPICSPEIDRGALCLLLRHNYIPAPYSIYKDISKLEPGCILTVSMAQPEPDIRKYWDAVAVACAGKKKPFSGTVNEVVDILEVLSKEAIHQQMVADVPLGAFLSGGVDSSTVVALMQAQASFPVKTFTIGFYEEGFNEAQHAKAIAAHLGTEHSELYVTHQQALEVIPRLPSLFCEPFSDSTQIPNFLLSQFARQHVAVALSGDAGDELFCGYDRYLATKNQWRTLSLLPYPLRALAAKFLTIFSPAATGQYGHCTLGAKHLFMAGDNLHKRVGKLSSRTVDDLYAMEMSHHGNPSELVVGGIEPLTYLIGRSVIPNGLDAVERMMMLDMISYLPDDILVKVDRTAMGVSLETRIPFLDHRLLEFVWSLPLSYKQHDGLPKWIMREILYRHVPRELIDRPKQGFSVPLHDWLRGPLHEWAESLLDEARLQREGFFRPAPIRRMWAAHLSGKHNWMALLWSVLMFQSWLEVQ